MMIVLHRFLSSHVEDTTKLDRTKTPTCRRFHARSAERMLHFIRRKAAASACTSIPVSFWNPKEHFARLYLSLILNSMNSKCCLSNSLRSRHSHRSSSSGSRSATRSAIGLGDALPERPMFDSLRPFRFLDSRHQGCQPSARSMF